MKIDKPIYAPSGKYKLALNDKGDITFIDTVPSDKVDIVYTEPLTEYLAPEAFVSQNGVQALVDPETGEYTFTPQSVAIVNEEHHRPLNPYTQYMQQKGVTPKDNEVEHLMTRHRADLAGERADLTPFFANLMTGGYAEAAKRGWEDIKNKNYFTGGTEILSPLMFGENYWNNLALGLYGGVHLLNDNGISKTWKEIKEGNYGNAALSAAGDLFNLTLMAPGTVKAVDSLNKVRKSLLSVEGTSQSKINNIRGIEGIPTEIEISPEELYKFLQEQEGYYFLGHGTGRNPGASEAIFNSGLRTKTGDISDTTIPLSESNLASWPHLNSEEIVILPGKIENVKYDYPYGRIPTDWFDNTTFSWNDNPGFSGRGIMAQENPHASFTKSIVDGIPGVYTKPEAVLGTYNTRTHTLLINPNSQYKFPLVRLNGTHFFTGTQETLPEVKFRGIIPKGEGNPLDTRLQRMMLRSKLKQENPEIYNLIYDENNPFVLPDLSISIVPRVRYDNIRKAMLDIDPNLSDVDLDMGIQIALANKKGVHFDLGNKSGDTIGGVNIVEIADAVNMVRKLHGREAIPYDISMIAGHELGHGVLLSDDALRAVSGYYDPYEFYTQAGQVLDNAGIINNTLSPLSFNKFINLTNNYLSNGNLDNGITKMRDFLMSLSPLERLAVMKNINRFSAGLFGAYLIGKGIKNGKVLS